MIKRYANTGNLQELIMTENAHPKVVSPFNGNRAYTLSEAETAVLHAIRGMKFGSIEVTMHDGRIVQIEKKEKMRFAGDVASPVK
jgi:hypothetical protein